VYGQKRMRMRLCADFRALDPDRQVRYVAHELIHCHVNTIAHVVEFDLRNSRLLGDSTLNLLEQTVVREVELAVDALSTVFAPVLVPIPWDCADAEAKDSPENPSETP
jgi:hypothetical protein